MKVELIACTPEPELIIETAARICYDSFDKISPPESTIKIIDHLIKSGHESCLEHASATFMISGVSRALTHQLVRHRIASYSQRSQRYVKETEAKYVIPPSIDKKILLQWEDGEEVGEMYSEEYLLYKKLMIQCWEVYNKLLKAGIKGEDARFVLPNACETEIIVTMNFRELRHFFKLRAESSHAQWEIRNMAKEMWNLIMKAGAANVFYDIKFEE